MSAHRLVYIGDSMHRNISHAGARTCMNTTSNHLCDSIKTAVDKTKVAALHFPSVLCVQEMVDAVVEISNKARQLKQHVISFSGGIPHS